MSEGYCTVPDVRRALQETIDEFDSGAIAEDDHQTVVAAITSQGKWLRDLTGCHFYAEGGIDEDEHDLVPTAPKSRDGEEGDIPSTPHPQHSTMFVADRGRYPHKTHGPYCRVKLGKHDVDSITALEVRDSGGGRSDWTDDSDKTEGDDYELYVEPGSAPSDSYVDLRASSLPSMRHYGGAVRVSYEYGEAELSPTIRRAVAMKAAAQLLAPDDDASLQIPDNANIQTVETKVSALERQAEELLEAYT